MMKKAEFTFSEIGLSEATRINGGLGYDPRQNLLIAAIFAIADDWNNFVAGLTGKPEVK